MKKLLILGAIFVIPFYATAGERDLAKEAAGKFITAPTLTVHCEDGDGDTYNNVDVFRSNKEYSKYAIVGSRLGEETKNGMDILVSEEATKNGKLSRRVIQNKEESSLSYFEVAKFEAPSISVTVYQEQLLDGNLRCAVKSKVKELDRDLFGGAMDGYTR